MNEATMPVLIGCAQVTDKRPPEAAGTPVELMTEVATKAAADAGVGQVLLDEIDAMVALGLTVDSVESGSSARGMLRIWPAQCQWLVYYRALAGHLRHDARCGSVAA
jgi:acetyl-CoA C-acetyltransferase